MNTVRRLMVMLGAGVIACQMGGCSITDLFGSITGG